jgi:hypothetical protein
MFAQWEEVLPGELWRGAHSGHIAVAQQFPHGAKFWIDGGALQDAPDLETAKVEADQAIGALVEPFEATGDVSRRSLKRTARANLHTRDMGVSTPESRAADGGGRYVSDLSAAERAAVTATQGAGLVPGAPGFAGIGPTVQSVRALAETRDPDQLAVIYHTTTPALLIEAALEIHREEAREEAQAAALVARLKVELAAATTRLKASQDRLEWLADDVIGVIMGSTGETRLEVAGHTVRIVQNPPHVVLDEDVAADPRLLPDEYQRIKVEPKKPEILETLKLGGAVPGASLGRSQRVEVKP